MRATEIVRVLDSSVLFNAEFYECHYMPKPGKALEPGFYVVAWPSEDCLGSYDETAEFFGPFATRQEAAALGFSASATSGYQSLANCAST
jgi:hypothetical protein